MKRPLICLGLASIFLTGCEDPPPVNKPEIIRFSVTCRAIDQGFGLVQKLDKISVRVRDLDGAADLLPPTVVVESTKLEMEAIEVETNAAEASCDAPEAKCDVEFRWNHGTSTEQIYCGESGDDLEVIFDIRDRDGNGGNYIIPAEVNSADSNDEPDEAVEEEGEE